MRCFALLLALLALGAQAREVTLKAADGRRVPGTFSPAKTPGKAIVLLFHQARSNRHEYAPMLPWFNGLGYDALAIDQRSGGKMWGHANENVGRGKSTEYLAAYPDLEAALAWAKAKEYPVIVAVGSSYSASLCFYLARDHGDDLAAIAVLSPGEYLGKHGLVRAAAQKITVPFFGVGVGPQEEGAIAQIVRGIDRKLITAYHPADAVHGASMLREDKCPHGYQANRQALAEFLTKQLATQ